MIAKDTLRVFVVTDAVLRVADDVRGTPPALFGDLWTALRDCLESRILRSASGGRASTEETSPRTGSSRKTEHLLDIYSGKTLGTFRIILSLFWPLRALQLRLVKIVKKGKRT